MGRAPGGSRVEATQCLGLEAGKAWKTLELLTTASGSFLGFRSAIIAVEGRWCRAGESLCPQASGKPWVSLSPILKAG